MAQVVEQLDGGIGQALAEIKLVAIVHVTSASPMGHLGMVNLVLRIILVQQVCFILLVVILVRQLLAEALQVFLVDGSGHVTSSRRVHMLLLLKYRLPLLI